MLVPNCIFRSNGAAILLSNKRKDSWRAKYELKHVVRTTISSDEAFGCVYQMEDDKGELRLWSAGWVEVMLLLPGVVWKWRGVVIQQASR